MYIYSMTQLISLLGIYPNEVETSFHTKTYSRMFIVFLITCNGNKPNLPQLGNDNQQHSHAREYYLAIKRNEPWYR